MFHKIQKFKNQIYFFFVITFHIKPTFLKKIVEYKQKYFFYINK